MTSSELIPNDMTTLPNKIEKALSIWDEVDNPIAGTEDSQSQFSSCQDMLDAYIQETTENPIKFMNVAEYISPGFLQPLSIVRSKLLDDDKLLEAVIFAKIFNDFAEFDGYRRQFKCDLAWVKGVYAPRPKDIVLIAPNKIIYHISESDFNFLNIRQGAQQAWAFFKNRVKSNLMDAFTASGCGRDCNTVPNLKSCGAADFGNAPSISSALPEKHSKIEPMNKLILEELNSLHPDARVKQKLVMKAFDISDCGQYWKEYVSKSCGAADFGNAPSILALPEKQSKMEPVKKIILEELNSLHLDARIRQQFVFELKVLPDKDLHYWKERLDCLRLSSTNAACSADSQKSSATNLQQMAESMKLMKVLMTEVLEHVKTQDSSPTVKSKLSNPKEFPSQLLPPRFQSHYTLSNQVEWALSLQNGGNSVADIQEDSHSEPTSFQQMYDTLYQVEKIEGTCLKAQGTSLISPNKMISPDLTLVIDPVPKSNILEDHKLIEAILHSKIIRPLEFDISRETYKGQLVWVQKGHLNYLVSQNRIIYYLVKSLHQAIRNAHLLWAVLSNDPLKGHLFEALQPQSKSSLVDVSSMDSMRNLVLDELNRLDLDPRIKQQFIFDLQVLTDKDALYWRDRLNSLRILSTISPPEHLSESMANIEKQLETLTIDSAKTSLKLAADQADKSVDQIRVNNEKLQQLEVTLSSLVRTVKGNETRLVKLSDQLSEISSRSDLASTSGSATYKSVIDNSKRLALMLQRRSCAGEKQSNAET